MALSYSQFYYGSSSGTLATFNSIRERTLGVPQSDIQDVIVNFDERHIYYCSSGNGISRSDLNLENVSGIVNNISGVVAIDIDFDGGFIYALNQIQGSITRYNINGSNPSGLISSGIVQATDLELDLINNNLYWCDRGEGVGFGQIRKVSLSETSGGAFDEGFDIGFYISITTVVSGLSGPAGLALDTENDIIYFSDDVDSTINQIPFSGGNSISIVSGPLISSPQKLQLDISRPLGLKSFENKNLFWTDKDLNFINAKSLAASASGSVPGSGFVVSGVSPIGFDFVRRIPRIRPGWHNTCFTSRRRLIIDDAAGGILNDIPIELNTNIPPLKLSVDRDPILQSFKSEEFGGKVASSSGLDILLASDDGLTQIPHEIEKYDPETGELILWALAPEVFDLQTTTLYMYYGDQDPFTDNQNPSGIWDVSHEAVWHLSELPSGNTGEIKDSTSNVHHGTASGSPIRVSGIHGFGTEFGVGDAINIDDTFDPPKSGTLLLRFYTSGQVSGAIFGIGDGFELEILPSSTGPQPLGMTVQSRIFATGTDVLKYTNTFGGVPPILPDEWHEIGVSWDFNTGATRIIINGDLRPEHNNSSNQADDDPGTGKLSIGKSTQGTKPTTNFILDEVRIANRPFSPMEVRTAFRVNVSDFADEEFEGQIYFERNEQVLVGDNLRIDPPIDSTPFWLSPPNLKNIPPFAVVELAIINNDDTSPLLGGVGPRDPLSDVFPSLSRGGPLGPPGYKRLLELHDSDLLEIGSGINVYTAHVTTNENGLVDGWGEQPIPFESSLTINLIGYWTSGTFITIEWVGGIFPSASGQWVSFDTNISLDPLQINNDVVEIIIIQPLQFDPVVVGVRASGSLLERKFNLHEASDGGDNLTLFSQAKSGIIEVFAEHPSVGFIINGWWSTPPDIYTEKYEKIGSPSGSSVWSTHTLADFLPKNNNTVIEIVLSNQQADGVNVVGIREVDSDINRLFHLHETHDSEDSPTTQDVIRLHTNVVARSGCGKEVSVPTVELYHSDTTQILGESGFVMVGVWGQSFISITSDIFTLHIDGHLPFSGGIDLYTKGVEEQFLYTEKFDSWFATLGAVWEQKDLTPFGVPSGSVVEILITNIDTMAEHSGGVREVGSILERRLDIHEAEGGGEEGLCMHVQVNGSGFIEQYAEDISNIKFTILGCWSGDVAYEERFTNFNASSFDAWVELDVLILPTDPLLDIIIAVEIVALQSHATAEQSGGVRTKDSIIERKFKLHKAEGGGLDFATFTTLSIDGVVEVFSSDSSLSFQLVGRWSKPPGTYNELFLDAGDPPLEGAGNFSSVDLSISPFDIPPFSTIDIALVNENITFPLQLGTRQQLSSLNRIVDIHKAERPWAPPTAQDVIRMQVAGRQLSIIELSNETFADTNFKVIGYWGELEPMPATGSIDLFIRTIEPISSGIDLFIRGLSLPGPPEYIEQLDTVTPTVAGSWEIQDLTSFGISPSAVVDILIANTNSSAEFEGGIREVGSVLERKFNIHEAEGTGREGVVLHTQVDINGQIETFAENTTDIEFVIVGSWSGDVGYTERFDHFNAASGNEWLELDVSVSGAALGDSKIIELVGFNSDATTEKEVGARSVGSNLLRKFNLHQAEGGGIDACTFLTNSTSGLIEVFAEDISFVKFRLVGYWNNPPDQYQERYIDIGDPPSSATFGEVDLEPSGIPADVVADINILNNHNSFDLDLGSRKTGSSISRIINTHKAEQSGGGEVDDVIRLQTNTTAGSVTVELYAEGLGFAHSFILLGFWGIAPTPIEDSIHLFTQGIDTSQSGIDLVIAGNEVQSSGIDLFIKVPELIQDNIDLIIPSPLDTINDNIDLFINGHQSTTSGIDLFIGAIDTISDDIDLIITGNEAQSGSQTLFIDGIGLAQDDLDLFMKVSAPIDDIIDLFISGPVLNQSGIDLLIHGIDTIIDNIDLFILGEETIQDNIDLVMPFVFEQQSGTIDLIVVGIESINQNIDLFIQGVAPIQDDITLFIQGPILVQNNIDLFISGPQLASGEITLFLDAQPFETGSIDLFIKNDFIQGTTTLFIEGFSQRQRACGIFFGDSTTDNIRKIDLVGGISIEEQVAIAGNPAGFHTDNVSGLLYWFDLSNGVGRGIRRTGFSILSGETSSTRTDTEDLSTSISKVDNVSDIAIDINGGKIYWSDTDDDVIRKANINIPGGEDASNRTDIEDILSISNPFSLVFDSVSNKIYWASITTDDIRRANLDGSNEEVIIGSGDVGSQIFAPDRLDINTRLGKIYWHDNGNGIIQRANLDGSSVETIVEASDPIVDVEAIVTDDVNIYFSDNSLNGIYKKSLDGSGDSILIVDNIVNPGINALALQLCPYESETMTLFISGPTPATNTLDLFIRSQIGTNTITLFIANSGTANSWDMFLKGFDPPTADITLFMRASQLGETTFAIIADIDLFIQTLPEPVIEEFGLNTKDTQLFLRGPFESEDSNSWQLFLAADSSSNAIITMHTRAHASGQPPIGVPISNDINLFVANVPDDLSTIGFTPIDDEWILFLKVRPGILGSITLSISGSVSGIPVDTQVDFFIQGFNVGTEDITLSVFGVSGILSNNIDLSIPNVIDDDDDNIKLYTHGY